MDEQTVALFEGDPQGSGLRLLARTRNRRFVQQARRWFAANGRADLAQLDRDAGEAPGLTHEEGKPQLENKATPEEVPR